MRSQGSQRLLEREPGVYSLPGRGELPGSRVARVLTQGTTVQVRDPASLLHLEFEHQLAVVRGDLEKFQRRTDIVVARSYMQARWAYRNKSGAETTVTNPSTSSAPLLPSCCEAKAMRATAMVQQFSVS